MSIMHTFFGISDIGRYTTWPINNPNAVQLVILNNCFLTMSCICVHMYSFEAKLYAFYDGLGPQYVTPVLYADNNRSPGEKLSIDEPVVDLTCQSSADNRWITVSIPLKERRIKPGYLWSGFCSKSFRPCFNYSGVYSFGALHYTMFAPDGCPPLIGSAVTVHPVGEINVTGTISFSDDPIPCNFLYAISSRIQNPDTTIDKRTIVRKKVSFVHVREQYNSIAALYRKVLQIIKLKEITRCIRCIHRFIFEHKKVRDYSLHTILRITLEKMLFSPITLIRFLRESIMNTVYAKQTALRLIVDTAVELENKDTCEIRFCKPDGTNGSFPATLLSESTSLIYYDIINETDLDISGWWKFWAYISFSDGRTAYGKTVKIFIADEGT